MTKKKTQPDKAHEPTAAEKADPDNVPPLTDAEILYLRKNVIV